MRDDHDGPEKMLAERVVARPTPKPPPPMPSAVPAPPPVTGAGKPAQPAGASPNTWEVDPHRLSAFSHAVQSARDRLLDVQAKVDRMRTDYYTPRLGISPVGTQLQEKFADRLDAPLDDPKNPTTGGLRPMLAEAMRRMDEFIAGAEAVMRAYTTQDDAAAMRITSTTTTPNG